MSLKSMISELRRIFCVGVAALMFSSTILLGWGTSAIAGEQATDIIQERAEKEFNRIADAGTANQIKGQVKEGVGTVQRQVDKTTSQIDGATKQVTGRAQKDIGRAQEAAEDAADATEESSENIVDSVKDFFGQ